ncbi:YcxB family protein [Flavobacterium sp. xlx-214]|uniref:YcxB family protein n=1 Tax=unclassified Flavobacterium TaxID=196869 RepID=UPI0013D62BF1|nr:MULTISPECIES: YcxB family protein [unclassified Flavobacterium]MBA5792743.1 YcxB family protein [Flavobacterium sp. xlx-221]QMI83880.1 YcxB family protein [Flavobacterium sp. xlx-214]
MYLEYSLSENDFLKSQLYSASKSKIVIKQRRRTFIILIVMFLVFLVSSYINQNRFPYLDLLFYCLFLIGYKIYEPIRYKKHYKKFINHTHKEKFGLKCKINFTEDQIIEESVLGESKINLNSLSEINEIQDYYFLRLITSESLIIPKNAIKDIKQFQLKMDTLKTKFNIVENIDLDWSWK